jgi:glycosyltransferase involved in cell wall biosynthesis
MEDSANVAQGVEGVFGVPDLSHYKIAVIIPCYNEEISIAQTVAEFRDNLPTAEVYVYDNASSDNSVALAREAGAIVRSETNRGKGNVVRRMFADVDADVYVMADGDATYDSTVAADLARQLIADNLDMLNGARRHSDDAAYRRGHRFGNRVLTGLVQTFFGRKIDDMLSGYRVFSRRFVKSFPSFSNGFEIETELTVHALQMKMPVGEVPTIYSARLSDSESKLSTYRDGLRILRMIAFLVKEERPLLFFSGAAAIVFLPSAFVFWSVYSEFLTTGAVARFPSLFASLAGLIISLLSIVCALILDTVTRARLEARRLSYLQFPPPSLGRSQRPAP